MSGLSGAVWVAALRKGIPYHAINEARTFCGRLIGNIGRLLPDGESRHGDFGWVLSEEKAVAEFAAKPCARCWPDSE